MAIGISGTRRTKDALLVHVHLSGDATDSTLSARVTTSEGAELPARVVRGEEEGDWFLSLAGLQVTQVLALTARSAEGDTVEELTHKLGSLSSRLPSPGNVVRRRGAHALSHQEAAASMLGAWDVSVDRLVETRDGYDICHGHAVLLADDLSSTQGDVRVTILDARGQDACGDPWICLADETAQLTDHPGFYVRRIEFSLKVPTAVTSLVAWVRPVEEGKLPAGFVSLGPRALASVRQMWKTAATSAADDTAYDTWFREAHAARPTELAMQQDSAFSRQRLFSIVSVVRTASPDELREMVDSLLEQTYEHFELVLVNSAPDNRRLASTMRGLELADARVHCVPLGADFGSAAATSEGSDAAVGDFVCLLREGDTLSPDALWCLAAALEANPHTDILYSDEDVVDHGRHVSPRFKPSWDPDLILGTNYVGGLMALRASLLGEAENMDRALDGAEWYHLVLYASERARKVIHIPRVLYHARKRTDTAAVGTASLAAGLLALRRHLDEMESHASARASARVQQGYEVGFPVPDETPLVSVIIVNRDGVASLDRCLASLREKNDYGHYEVIIVEQGSVEAATFEYYRQAEAADPRVHTIFYQGKDACGWAQLVNFGVSRAKGAYILLLAPSIEATEPGWMRRLVSLCERATTGAAGARLVRTDGTIASTGAFLSPEGPVWVDRYRFAADCSREEGALLHTVTIASGSCLMVDAAAFKKVGGMNVAFAGRYGDADLCLRLAGRGYRVVLDPQVVLTCHQPLADDEVGEATVEDLRAVGRLWESWPYGTSVVDPTMEPNIDPHSPYHALNY